MPPTILALKAYKANDLENEGVPTDLLGTASKSRGRRRTTRMWPKVAPAVPHFFFYFHLA